MSGNTYGETSGLSICRTCVHAEDAGHLTRDADLFICRALVPPLRDYAASNTPEYVLVNGCAPACQEHYERDEAAFDALWREELSWDDSLAHPAVIGWDHLLDSVDGRLW